MAIVCPETFAGNQFHRSITIYIIISQHMKL